MKLSKKMLKELISEVVKERFDGAPLSYPSEEERSARMRKQGLIPEPGEEIAYQKTADPRDKKIAKMRKEITRLESMNLALVNQMAEYGLEPKMVVRTDPDADPEADTIVKK